MVGRSQPRDRRGATLAALLVGASVCLAPARAADVSFYLMPVFDETRLASTIADNGDLNPAGLVVAPESLGDLRQGDVLVDNFNSRQGVQGAGTTIVRYSVASGEVRTFATVDPRTAHCPGGVGLTAAFAVLRRGWIVVGSAPSASSDRHRGRGCLLVIDRHGKRVATWSGPLINEPWGNAAVVDDGKTVTMFVAMAGRAPPGAHANSGGAVVRLRIRVPSEGPPQLTDERLIARGFPIEPSDGAPVRGPSGLALDKDGALYVADDASGEIFVVDHALTRRDGGGGVRTLTSGVLLKAPASMAWAPDGRLLVANSGDGEVVEVDPRSGRQVFAQWIDIDEAQTPPGAGDLRGLAMRPDGRGFYYVQDDTDALMAAEPPAPGSTNPWVGAVHGG